MATYYDVTLTAPIPQGSNILNKPCTVTFNYPDGSFSHTFSGTIFAWFTPTTVRITSASMNIQDSWAGANGGTLTIATGGGLAFVIAAFAIVP